MKESNPNTLLILGALAVLAVLAALYDGRWVEIAGAAAVALLVSLGVVGKPVIDAAVLASAMSPPKEGQP
jgi:hypothetical protein